MKKLLLLAAILITLSAKAQTSVYHPFPEDSATWVTDIFYNTCFGYCSSIFYEMKGDTIINSQSYNKIYSRYGRFYYIIWPPNSVVGVDSFSACSYRGAIRQDSISEKVYFIDSTMTTDTLLYDFNLTIGDTIQSWYNKWYMPWPLIVSGIDSISINGNYHKRFNFQGYLTDQNMSLIEGIGWSGELFGTNLSSALVTGLSCFDGNIILGEAFINECSPSLDCSISVGINEQNKQKHFDLFPNPFSDKLNFTINNNELSEIIIYDIT
ncbi:MAG: hypothetical protein ABI855_13665, partial [Bacteroidota bacterium]